LIFTSPQSENTNWECKRTARGVFPEQPSPIGYFSAFCPK